MGTTVTVDEYLDSLDQPLREIGAMASVKLRSVSDIDEPLFTDWLNQAQALESKAGV